MSDGFFKAPPPVNSPVKDYAPGNPETKELQDQIKAFRNQEKDIPMYIGGQEVYTDNKTRLAPPHDHQHTLGYYSRCDAGHVQQAIKAALGAKADWEAMDWQDRAAIFLKAAELLEGPWRQKLNAATVLGQSKNPYQAEIDSACELIDFLRFNVHFMTEIYGIQPNSPQGVWNRTEHRPLEGFIFAITPFNFTAIAGNLPSAPAMMGNTVVWKPADTQVYAAHMVMELFKEAGLPDGVINLIYGDGPVIGEEVFQHPEFAGLHFTGSTKVFQSLWKTIGNNIETYNAYPRIVGETGGKDYIIAHHTAKPKQVATAIVRGAFEFQGQKCSAVSRVYLPDNIWDDVKDYMLEDLKTIKMGTPEDFSNFFNAVISEQAFDKIARYIDAAKESNMTEVIAGGNYDKSEGYFIEPTVIVTEDPMYTTMCEEIFGPVVTIYVYKADNFKPTLELLDQTSMYGLTGAIFSQDRHAIKLATQVLRHSAGNFYINDKPTGAVVYQQPFGGGRKSGTNDKAGGPQNLWRWVNPRSIKENFVPTEDYRYPFLGE